MPALANPKHEAFAQKRVEGMGINEAYVAAGYASNPGNAGRLNREPHIAARMAELLGAAAEIVVERIAVTKERVLDELAKLGFSNMLDYVSVRDDGFVHLDMSALNRDQAAAIQEVVVDEYMEHDPDGEDGAKRTVKKVKFKLYDKRGALVDMGRHLGMFKDQVEVTGKGGGPVKVKDVTAPRELARRIAFALAKGQQQGKSA